MFTHLQAFEHNILVCGLEHHLFWIILPIAGLGRFDLDPHNRATTAQTGQLICFHNVDVVKAICQGRSRLEYNNNLMI